jgi:integrase
MEDDMAGTTLSEAIDRYMAYREGNQLKPSTLRSNRYGLSKFLAHTGNVQMWHLQAEHGQSFRRWMTEKQYEPATICSFIDTLTGFVLWCHEMRLLPPTSNPLFGIKRPKIIRKQRQRIPGEDFNDLLDCAHLVDARGRTIHGSAHDRIVVAIGLYTLIRQSEIISLRVGDANLDNMFLDVTLHKGGGEHDIMPISMELERELRRWLRWYANDTMDEFGPMLDSWFLVGSNRAPDLETLPGMSGGRAKVRHTGNSNPLKPCYRPEHSVQRTLVRYGIPIRATNGKSLREGVHTLRRSGARAMYDGLVAESYDGALREVQAWLHHANAAMTERYIGIDLDVKKRNDRVRGKVMFPQARPTGSNIVPLHAVSDDN